MSASVAGVKGWRLVSAISAPRSAAACWSMASCRVELRLLKPTSAPMPMEIEEVNSSSLRRWLRLSRQAILPSQIMVKLSADGRRWAQNREQDDKYLALGIAM